MKYRPEIDGLRAVAVLPVIFFHAGISIFRGGYVGVDIFFVISGYLITTIILLEKEAGKFTIANFYERRARRIVPALTVVLLACLPFAYYWMLPKALEEFSQSLIAVSLFSSNILFWRQAGYFETATELKPLLHTWSLAVEEQYYLFFPLFIILAWRFGKRTIIILLVMLGAASLIMAQWGSGSHPVAAFYLIPTRLWEILIGSLIAFYLLRKSRMEVEHPDTSFMRAQVLSVLGLLLVLYSIVVFDENTPFPSLYTLIPTLGTALIILFASGKTHVGAALSNKLFVGIGLISYSAYLWHQPIFAFARIISVNEPGDPLMFALGIAALALAYLTWKYVETPFRDKSRFDRRRIFQFAAVSSLVMISVGSVGYLNQGFGDRIAPNSRMSYAELALITRQNFGLDIACSYISFDLLDQCQTGDSPEILVWGDSFAMHLIPGILASNPDAEIIQITQSVCGPIVGMARTNSKYPRAWAEECVQFNDSVIAWLRENPGVKYVVLGSPFSQYFGENNVLVNGEIIPADKAVAIAYLEATLSLLSEMGAKPVVFAPPPSNGEDIGNCLVKNAFFEGGGVDCRIKTSVYKDVQKDVLELLEVIGKRYPVVYVSDVLCDDTFCATDVEGVFIYRDFGHLSIEGSMYLGRKMDFYGLITSNWQP